MPMALGTFILSALPGIAGLGTAASITIAGVSLASIVGTAAIAGALIGLQMLMPKPGLPKPEDGAQAIRQAISPRIGGYGRARIAGCYVLYEELNGVSYDVLALVSGRIGGVVQYYLHEDAVTVVGGVVQPGADERYGGDLIVLSSRLGQATETPYSLDDLSDIWGSNHRGDGIASLALICHSVKSEDFQKFYPHGLPQPSAVLDLYPIWDPRDAGQSRENPATWVVSSNPVLQLIDYLTHPDHGMALDYEALIAPVIDQWMAEATLCDEHVAKVGGTQPRYQSNGWYTFDTKPEDVIGGILAACDGWLAEDGEGRLALKVGVYRAPTVIIEERHILGFAVDYGVPDEERVNELALSFTSPEHKYKSADIPPWRDEADISATGRVRSQALQLTWVQDNAQARRLGKRAMHRLNPSMRGSLPTTLYGITGLGERWINIRFPTVAGLEDAVVEVQKASVDILAGRVSFEWIKIDPDTVDAWDPAAEEGDGVTVPEAVVSDPLPVPQNPVAAVEDGALIVTFDEDPDRDLAAFEYRIRYRVDGAGAWAIVSGLAATADVPTRLRINAGTVPAVVHLELQVAAVGSAGSIGGWSVLMTIDTTP